MPRHARLLDKGACAVYGMFLDYTFLQQDAQIASGLNLNILYKFSLV